MLFVSKAIKPNLSLISSRSADLNLQFNTSSLIMVAEKITWKSIEGKEHPTLSPGFVSNGHVFTSGIIGSNYATGETPEKVEDQVHLAIKNLEAVLKAGGSSLDKVFKVTMFISHAEYSKVVNEIYGQYFPQKPARSCVVVAFMDAAIKYELEAIATLE
ncbi:unnamed protein product [Kuraishia capsulata CBS 1993]|uniref:Uncharacterized protein n=1 Tax=Kuraishia capsulata CBS 1993 TaxID=1382522 RepID=W6MWB0_9ASCO|nr:uncharacterized protein KUCA_T00003107001 [Kuraishia capsulata CBS 1993]CDK27130.1 unnamed protein product [Kuraishia capsulata CBS 1993]